VTESGKAEALAALSGGAAERRKTVRQSDSRIPIRFAHRDFASLSGGRQSDPDSLRSAAEDSRIPIRFAHRDFASLSGGRQSDC